MPPHKAIGSLKMTAPEGEEAYQVANSAQDELTMMGIYLAEKPEFDKCRFVHDDGSPKMPQNMQDLTDMEIGELYNIVETFFSYVVGRFAKISNEYLEASETFKFIAAIVRSGKAGRQQDKTDSQITDRRYVLANAKALELKCLYNLLSKVKEKLEADMKLISRNITLREQRIKTGGRAASIGARKKFSAHPRDVLVQYEETTEEPEAPPIQRVKKRRPPRRRPSIPVKR